MSVYERFMDKVEHSDECWRWTGSIAANGYSRLWVDGRIILAHRVAYELFVGPIPDGLQIDHLCRNRGCVNPAHLEPVTAQENFRRSPTGPASRTHCPAGHPYDGANLIVARKRRSRRQRFCRECKNARRRVAA